jgi:methionine-S-sulfoxide reductase
MENQKTTRRSLILLLSGLIAAGCSPLTAAPPQKAAPNSNEVLPTVPLEIPEGREVAVLAGGCFWCLDTLFAELKGVDKVASGYAGGSIASPSYEAVCTGATGHAEAIQITFDPKVITYNDLLHIFFSTHDPTTLNRQGPDYGTQYRSAIFYTDERQKSVAEKVIKEVNAEKAVPAPHCNGSDCLQELLCGGRLPPELLCKEPESGVLPRCHRTQGAEVSAKVSEAS